MKVGSGGNPIVPIPTPEFFQNGQWYGWQQTELVFTLVYTVECTATNKLLINKSYNLRRETGISSKFLEQIRIKLFKISKIFWPDIK